MTKYTPRGLGQDKWILSQGWRPEVRHQGRQGPVLQAQGRVCFRPLPAPGAVSHPGILARRCATPVSASISM